MASQEQLRKTYPSKITPEHFGSHFNPAPKPDALGRKPATPLEIQRAINGEFSIVQEKQPGFKKPRRRTK